jgi:ankyrin repeat protein
LDFDSKGASSVQWRALRRKDFEGCDNPFLLQAVSKGNADIVAMMLEAGIDVNAKNLKGKNALMAAVEQDDQGMVARLLKAGADPDSKDATGQSARMLAEERQNPEISRMLSPICSALNTQMTAGNETISPPILE